MSSNLLKQMHTVVQPDDKRVIDTNRVIQSRLEEIAKKTIEEQRQSGFLPGLDAERIEIPQEDVAAEIEKKRAEAEELLEQAKTESQIIRTEAKAEAERMKSLARSQAEAEKERIREEARSQGYDQGMEQAKAQEDKLTARYQEKEKELEDFYCRQMEELEPKFVDAITSIYEHIFHVELGSYREILTHLIASTLRKLESSREFLIHVSREDYPFVNMQKKQLSAVVTSDSLDVVEDMALHKNDCLIETEGGIFDCGLDTELTELRQRLVLLSWAKEE